MSPTVPPISVMTTSTRSGALAAGHDPRLDLVGDVRDDLHGVAEVLPAPLLGDHLGVHLAGRHVGPAGEVDVEEALVVTDVEVGLGAVLGDEDLAVLERVHRPGVDVEVGVQLLHRDPKATAGQQGTQRTRCQSLAERGHNPAGDEDELRRLGVVKKAEDHVFQTVDPRDTTVTRSAPSTGPEWGAPPAVSPEPVPPRPAPAASQTISGTSRAAAVAGSGDPGVVDRGAEHQAQQRRQQHRADDEHLLGRQPGGPPPSSPAGCAAARRGAPARRPRRARRAASRPAGCPAGCRGWPGPCG